ncbi:MAG: ABC transporter permease subunit [Opitutales bacterium]|nr:ABC transporter permease subunit [Opitutales bacterium]MCH8540333.1 ABC transporter permease subunit [Opitutales bacterium]
MSRLLLRRLLEAIPTLLAVITITFFLLRLAPGGPFADERDLSPQAQAAMEAHYGLDQPLVIQYFRYLGNLARGDLGPSFRYPTRTVNEIIVDHFPVSLELGALGFLVALALGLGAGLLAASFRQRKQDHFIMTMAMVGICLPTFVLGPLLVYVFSLQLGWFNVGGWGHWSDRILPGFVLGSFFAAYVARLTRNGVGESMQMDYYRTALAKGLSKRQALWKHALKPGILPTIAFLGPAAAGLLTGSFVVESVFNIPGLGQQFINAAFGRDFTVVTGLVILYAVLILFFNLAVDFLQALLDPKLRES